MSDWRYIFRLLSYILNVTELLCPHENFHPEIYSPIQLLRYVLSVTELLSPRTCYENFQPDGRRPKSTVSVMIAHASAVRSGARTFCKQLRIREGISFSCGMDSKTLGEIAAAEAYIALQMTSH